MIIITIALATGSEDLNNAIVDIAKQQDIEYKFYQVHYREYLLENDNYDTCIISSVLPGEIELNQVIHKLKTKNKRIILILVDNNKEEYNICVKYQVVDVLSQPVTPENVLDKIKIPGSFTNIEYMLNKLGEEKIYKYKKQKDNNKEIIKDNKANNIVVCETNICILDLSQGAGATFLTLNLAKKLSSYIKVTVIEKPLKTPKIYYTIGIENKVDKFIDYSNFIDKNLSLPNNQMYTEDDIKYLISNPYNKLINEWDEQKMLKLIQQTKTPLKLIDIGTEIDNYFHNMFEHIDCIIVVIDPYIPNILANMKKLKEIKNLEKIKKVNVKYVINKFNSGIDKTELLNNMDIDPIAFIPFIESQLLYRATNESKIPYNYKKVKKQIDKSLEKIAKIILPKEINIKKRGI